MKTSVFVCCLLSFACHAACAEESDDNSDATATEKLSELTPEQLKQLLDELMADETRGFVIPPPNSGPLEDRQEYSGQWIDRNGVKNCDGYLTRLEDDEYCSSEIPSDWVPFKFEGRTFFVQPLSDNDS